MPSMPPFALPRFQSLTEVPVWEVLQSGADRNHGALRGREIHLNEHSGWIQVSAKIQLTFPQLSKGVVMLSSIL